MWKITKSNFYLKKIINYDTHFSSEKYMKDKNKEIREIKRDIFKFDARKSDCISKLR